MSINKIAEIEFVNFPEASFKRSKIVQLYVKKNGKEIPIMIFQIPNEQHSRNHYQILKQYLKNNNINFEPKKDEPEMPALKGNNYRVVGMGEIELNHKNKYFEYPFDYSIGYNIEPAKEFNPLILQKFNELEWKYVNDYYDSLMKN